MASASSDAGRGAERCPGCREPTDARRLDRGFRVCPHCGHHGRLGVAERLRLVVDPGSFRERDAEVSSADPLGFVDRRSYVERLHGARQATGRREAILTGTARIARRRIAIGVFDFAFLGGTMGTAVGERLARLIEHAGRKRLPLVVFAASGGARMQEGIFSLLQMVKVTAALARLRTRRVPFLSVLTDPTTGGVAASLALLGDVNLAEPGALIGFAGPRVVEQTIQQRLPAGLQSAESLRERGMVDLVVPRPALRATLARLLALLVGPARVRQRRTRRAS
jgi:acetyl-CoA carboxylase carboxyl transferase subunit beta